MMSGHGTIETAVEATRLGAYDFLEKPLSTAKLLLAVRRALEAAQLRRENIGLRREALQASEPIGRSTLMSSLRDQVKRIAEHDTPVLITGESGCGKELIARYLPRAQSAHDGAVRARAHRRPHRSRRSDRAVRGRRTVR